MFENCITSSNIVNVVFGESFYSYFYIWLYLYEFIISKKQNGIYRKSSFRKFSRFFLNFLLVFSMDLFNKRKFRKKITSTFNVLQEPFLILKKQALEIVYTDLK